MKKGISNVKQALDAARALHKVALSFCLSYCLMALVFVGLFLTPSVLMAQTCTGSATVMVAQTGVTNPNNALGDPNSSAAQLYETADQIALQLSNTLTAGMSFTIRWRRAVGTSSNPTVAVETSADGVTYTAVSGSPFTLTQSTYVNQVIQVATATKYVRFTSQNVYNTDLDAVSFDCIPFLSSSSPTCANTTEIGGIVFNDFDADGIFDITASYVESGEAGLNVAAYDSDDLAGAPTATATTNTDGTYLLTGLTAGRAYRLELSWTAAWLKTGASGNTTVNVVTAGTCNVNMGVNNPANYCEPNPLMITSCFVDGNPLGGGTAANGDVLITYPFLSTGTATTNINKVAVNSQMGAVWGIAFQRSTKHIFASALMKRHAGFGALGIDGIYKIDYTNPAAPVVSNWLELNTLAGVNVGADPRGYALPANLATASADPDAFGAIGKVGIGDIDISEDDATLYAMNLNNNGSVVVIDIATKALIQNIPITNPGCGAAGDVRPWGIEYYQGSLYIGLVCNGQIAGASDLQYFVMRWTGSAWVTVSNGPLTYSKGKVHNDFPTVCNAWQTWTDNFTDLSQAGTSGAGPRWCRPQPILSDLEFDEQGNLYLGFLDRLGNQTGYLQRNTADTQTGNGYVGGDLLKVAYKAGVYTLENAGTTVNGGGCGANGQGPGGGEFFADENLTTDNNADGIPEEVHQETSLGALSYLPGYNQIAVNVMDPLNIWSGGTAFMQKEFGTADRQFQLYNSSATGGTPEPGTFGKAAGLGDIELLCKPAPIEIGNYVWYDADEDGIQDPNETGIAGVTVKLFKGGVEIAAATTNANGRYIFSNDKTKTSTANFIYGIDLLLPDMAYEIRLENFAAQTPLSNLRLTLRDNGGSDANTDLRDSDGTLSGANALKTFTTGGAGANDHTYDFGFRPVPPCSITVVASASECYDSNGNVVGGTSQSTVRAVVDWINNPSGETITVSVAGAAATQSINPATSLKPAVLFFDIPADGASHAATATFSTTTTCTATQNITAPVGNCLLTPCCPTVLNAPQTFSNATVSSLAVQTDCNTTLTRTFNVSGLTGTVYDANVGLLLTHTFRGDLKIQLTSPMGTTVTLANQSTDNNDHYDLLLDDSATGTLNNGSNQDTLAPNFAADRSAKPSNPLSTFNGESPNGTWTLTFCNTNFSSSNGRLLTVKEVNLALLTKQASNCAAKTGGNVWRDFNNNGVKNTNENEGVAAVTVKAFDCNGNLVETVTTDYLGQYTLANVTPSVSNPIRLEFSNIPAPYKPSAAGTDNGTDVRFITSPNCSYNLGINSPADYCQPNPSLTINCYVSGAYNSSSGTGRTIIGLPYNFIQDPDGNTNGTTAAGTVSFDPPIYTPARPMKTPIADHNQIASTWGLAYDRAQRNLFAAAYVKSGTSLGPNNESTGKIYKINNPLSTPTVSDYVDLNTIFGAGTAGANPHPIATTNFSALGDVATNAVIGKVGLGDMAISNDNAFLYTVNLADRKLYKIPTSGALNSTTIKRFDIPTTGLPTVTDAAGTAGTCPNGDMRPFGLGVHPDGSIYVGGVCSAESVSAGLNAVDNPASYQVTAYVWKFDGTAFTLQLNESLRFDRDGGNGYATFDDYNASYTPQSFNLDWEPWHDLSSPSVYNFGSVSQNEPMLADISFDEKGDMFVGVRDRAGDIVSYSSGFLSSGDIYKACKTTTGWAFEKNASCGGVTTGGVNNKQGPNGGEFIFQDIQGDGLQNSGTGGVFNLMGQYQAVSTTIDPVYLNSSGSFIFNPSAGGVQVFGTQDGILKGAYDIYESNDINTFAKAAGVGAIAALCDPAPIQIGNYVWKDTDRDGVQDPCETPLSNVVISLWKNGVQVATTTTNARGNYTFTGIGAPNETWTSTSGTDSILPNMAYEIRIDTTNQAQLDTLKLTTANATASSGNDQNDSDASVTGNYAVVSLTTGDYGATNHAYDFGFYPICDTTLTVSNTTICDGSSVNLFAQASGVKGTLSYSTDGNTWTALTNPTNVTPSVSSTYFIKDTLTSGCVDIDTLQITVNQPVTAGVGTNPATATCQAGSRLSNINLAGQITGATAGGVWSQTVGTAVGTALNTATGVFNPNGIQVGTYTFRYTVTGATPCPNATTDITITIQNCCPPSVCIPVTVVRN